MLKYPRQFHQQIGNMTNLEKLSRRLRSAETYTLCCEASRDVLAAESARSDCELVELEASKIYAEIVVADPASENAKTARCIADQISDCVRKCRDKMSKFKHKRRSIKPISVG